MYNTKLSLVQNNDAIIMFNFCCETKRLQRRFIWELRACQKQSSLCYISLEWGAERVGENTWARTCTPLPLAGRQRNFAHTQGFLNVCASM